MKAPAHYDAGHPYAHHDGKGTRWLGDPARGEFKPEKMQPKKKGKRRG